MLTLYGTALDLPEFPTELQTIIDAVVAVVIGQLALVTAQLAQAAAYVLAVSATYYYRQNVRSDCVQGGSGSVAAFVTPPLIDVVQFQ